MRQLSCLISSALLLLTIGTFAVNVNAASYKAEPIKQYVLVGSNNRYGSISALSANVEAVSAEVFDRCMADRAERFGEYGACTKRIIVGQQPASWSPGYTNNEPRVWELPANVYEDLKHAEGHDITTEPTSSFGAITTLSCPEGFVLAGEGPRDDKTVWCEKVEEESCDIGNPIDLMSGRKTERETDYQSSNGLLRVERRYIDQFSGWVVNQEPRLLPVGGSGSVSTQGVFNGAASAACISPTVVKYTEYTAAYDYPSEQVHYYRVECPFLLNQSEESIFYVWLNGKEYRFVKDGAQYVPAAGARNNFKIEAANVAGLPSAVWKLTERNGGISYFDEEGLIVRKVSLAGGYVNYAYTGGALTQKTDHTGRSLQYQYNSDGRIEAIVLPDASEISYSYVSNDPEDLKNYWLIDQVAWPTGESVSYTYNETEYGGGSGKDRFLTGKFDANGERIGTYQYMGNKAVSTEGYAGADKRKVTVRNPRYVKYEDGLGTVRTKYFYDELADGRKLLTRSLQPPGSGCSSASNWNTYNANGQVTERRDYNGNKTQYAYDALRHLETVRVSGIASGVSGDFTVDNISLPAGVVKTSTEWHASLDQPARIASPGKLTTFVYNGFPDPFNGGQMANCSAAPVEVDGLPLVCRSVEQATLDDQGQHGFAASLDAGVSSRHRLYTYDQYGKLLSASRGGSSQAETTITYYASTTGLYKTGDVKSVENAAGHKIEYLEYDDHGNPIHIGDANGVNHYYIFDSQGRLLSKSVNSAQTTYSYDLNGNLVGSLMPNGTLLTYQYDAAKRLMAIENAQGDQVDYEYDGEGNLLFERINNASGTLVYSKEHVYDALSRLQNTVNSHGDTGTYFYDAEGNLTRTRDAKQRDTDYRYDALNQMVESEDAAGGETAIGYDAQGRVTSVEDPNGAMTSYEHNAFGEVTQLTSPDTGTTTYEYDAAGNRTAQVDARGIRTEYSYDVLNRLTQVHYPSDSSLDVSYTYDQGANGIGRLTRIDDATGYTTYSYDAWGNVVSQTQVTGGNAYTVGYSYNADNQLQSVTYPSGKVVDYSFSAIGNVSDVTLTSGSNTSSLAAGIAYLPFGPSTGWTLGNGLVVSRAFDLDYRLTEVQTDPVIDYSYGYDPVGNIIQWDNLLDTSRSQSFDYDALDRLTDATGLYGDFDYTYDPVGNRLSKSETGSATTDTYAYDPASNRLTGITGANPESMTYDAVGNIVTRGSDTFTYSARNRLAQVERNSAVIAQYQHNGKGERVVKTAGGHTTHFVYDLMGNIIATANGAGVIQREYVYVNGERLALLQQSPTQATYYYYNDHLGTPKALTNASGTVVWQADYTPFGELTETVSIVEQPFRFPGQYFDGETGLYYNYFRDYDPGLGRYVQSDPIGLGDGPNTYGYAQQNPNSLFDKYGLNSLAACANPANAAACAAAGVGGRAGARAVARTIIRPKEPRCGCACTCRADANDNIPGNIQEGDKKFAFGTATADNCAKATKAAKRKATHALGKQPKHVGCLCSGK